MQGTQVYHPGSSLLTDGLGALAGLPINSGYVDRQGPSTDGNGVARLNIWPSQPGPLTIYPPAGGRLIATTTPPLDLSTTTDVLVAYQANGTVSVIIGSADAYTAQQNALLHVATPGVLANDHPPTGFTAEATLAQGPAHGTVTLNANGSFDYTRAASFSGTDQFTYRLGANGLQSGPIPVTITILSDTTPPTVTGQPDRASTAGWFTGPVTITWSSIDPDPSSGTPTTPAPTTIATEGTHQVVTSAASCDPAGNCATGQYTVSIDSTAPILGAPAWTANPKPATGTSTLTVSANDTLSGVAAGEYFIDTDHGPGANTPMSLTPGGLSASIGTNLTPGVYQVGIRAKDTAGNWSAPTYTMLVVYDPAITVGTTGKNKNDLVPSLVAGDILPGLTAQSQTDTVDQGFTVDYANGTLDPHNDLMLRFNTGSQCNSPHPTNCHTFTMSATSFAWLIIDQANASRSRFQGVATVNVDGTVTSNPFTVEGIDGDRLTPATNDHLTLNVYAPGADPAIATPIYHVSAPLAKGNSVKIR